MFKDHSHEAGNYPLAVPVVFEGNLDGCDEEIELLELVLDKTELLELHLCEQDQVAQFGCVISGRVELTYGGVMIDGFKDGIEL